MSTLLLHKYFQLTTCYTNDYIFPKNSCYYLKPKISDSLAFNFLNVTNYNYYENSPQIVYIFS